MIIPSSSGRTRAVSRRPARGDERQVARPDVGIRDPPLVDVGHLVHPLREGAGPARRSPWTCREVVVVHLPLGEEGSRAADRDVGIQGAAHGGLPPVGRRPAPPLGATRRSPGGRAGGLPGAGSERDNLHRPAGDAPGPGPGRPPAGPGPLPGPPRPQVPPGRAFRPAPTPAPPAPHGARRLGPHPPRAHRGSARRPRRPGPEAGERAARATRSSSSPPTPR